MKKLKKSAVLAALLALTMCALPVNADNTQTPETAEGSADVVAEMTDHYLLPVAATVSSTTNQVTYAIDLPIKIEFDETLEQPRYQDEGNVVQTAFAIGATDFDNFNPDTDRVNVYIQRPDMNSPFQLLGTGAGTLSYTVLPPSGVDLLTQTPVETDKYLFSSFGSEGTEHGTLTLDLNQLLNKDMTTWGGSYHGQLHFYSKVEAKPTDTP